MAERKKLLITGAAGNVGTAIRHRLNDRYRFRLVFHNRIPGDIQPEEEVLVSDVSDLQAMVDAADGVDAIVHLAIHRWGGMSPADLVQATFEKDMKGTYNIYEAARLNGVPTVVFASTNHVTGYYEKNGLVSHPDAPVRPDSIYGTGKAFGEALGRHYSDHYGLRVICLRIANFGNEETPRQDFEPGKARWLSPRDLAQLVWRSLETTDVKFGVFYGVSGGSHKKWDLSNAGDLLGYVPQDDGSRPGLRRKRRHLG
jgi:uronate dehydrogenase